MALDVQRNWDVCMAENFEKVTKRNAQGADEKDIRETITRNEPPKVWNHEPIHLPDEVLIQILEYVARFQESQYTLASCCLLSRQWYRAAVPLLYASPYLHGKHFELFQRVVIPSLNLQVRASPLAELVKVLDLRGLVHDSSRRTTARLLGRTKGNLEAFIAPQKGFATNSFPALSKCHQLRILDLSLVSESPPLFDLLKTVSRLDNLVTFRLPHSGFKSDTNPALITWPRRLENLTISGGIDAHFMHGVVAFPPTLRSLTIEYCANAKGFALMHMLRVAVRPLPNLEILKLAHLRLLSGSSLDNVLLTLPGLTRLSVSVDYISPALFDFDVGGHRETITECHFPALPHAESLPSRHKWTEGKQCELRTLELTWSGTPGVEDKISPIDVVIALDEGTLPNLKQVRVDKSLLWQSSSTAADVDALADALKATAVQRGEDDETGIGVWTF